ncbi:hypothetical protein T265_08058 [Opisthorchis viverrini]|uniref:Uncharacterized protein n=1 Tax=Opisthorchis viverrini TaxID=6198 RepID=A0A074ZAB8_OPIVI|nr:hypothetical protein T265_08058 [Opisthorchis viverrini]KER24211.1 hypothetical protein T265_08058 [Opisthorchis viverrini]
MRQPGAAHSVAWKHHKREIQLGSSLPLKKTNGYSGIFAATIYNKWLERKVCLLSGGKRPANKESVWNPSIELELLRG